MSHEASGRVYSEAQAAIADISGYYAIIPEELLYSGNSTAIVLYGILDRIASRGEGYASLGKLAYRMKSSEATVRRARKYLEENGWIVVTNIGSGRLATDYALPFQRRAPRGNEPDTPGVASVVSQTETTIPENQTESIQQLLDPTTRPEWWGLGQTLQRWTIDYETAHHWAHVDNGYSDEYLIRIMYRFRAWWGEKQIKAGRDAYASFQSAVRDAWGEDRGQPSGRTTRPADVKTPEEQQRGWGDAATV